jgi:hypothetical protein
MRAPAAITCKGIAMKTAPNFSDHDAFYEQLLAAHEGVSEAQSAQLNARLILLLANQLGDQNVLAECIAAARDTMSGAKPAG